MKEIILSVRKRTSLLTSQVFKEILCAKKSKTYDEITNKKPRLSKKKSLKKPGT